MNLLHGQGIPLCQVEYAQVYNNICLICVFFHMYLGETAVGKYCVTRLGKYCIRSLDWVSIVISDVTELGKYCNI